MDNEKPEETLNPKDTEMLDKIIDKLLEVKKYISLLIDYSFYNINLVRLQKMLI